MKRPFFIKDELPSMRKDEYVVIYTEGPSPKGEQKVIDCMSKEQAFLEEFNLRNKAWHVRVYKKVNLKIENNL